MFFVYHQGTQSIKKYGVSFRMYTDDFSLKQVNFPGGPLKGT